MSATPDPATIAALAALDDQSHLATYMAGFTPDAPSEPSTEQSEVKAAARTNAKAATNAKVKEITRNLDALDIEVESTDDTERAFRVVPSGQSGPFYNGARIIPVVNGKTARSFTRDDVESLGLNVDEVIAGIEKVEKRAKIGHYIEKVAKVAAPAA